MPLFADLSAFAAALPAKGSLLALDLSKRRIGCAGTDVERRLVTPLTTWQRQRFADDVERLKDLVRRREVVALVIGLPLLADGGFGPRAQAAKETAKAIDARLGLPIWLQDERYSTVEAADRGGDDSVAAAVILEDALAGLRCSAGRQP
ncbi:MAG: Holliday junction resolvase RuvX [Geminicoccaceae bacterium]|nr:MAG: Holliday junction resolvase RuvX [Geminicoccaceae bacterium]